MFYSTLLHILHDLIKSLHIPIIDATHFTGPCYRFDILQVHTTDLTSLQVSITDLTSFTGSYYRFDIILQAHYRVGIFLQVHHYKFDIFLTGPHCKFYMIHFIVRNNFTWFRGPQDDAKRLKLGSEITIVDYV